MDINLAITIYMFGLAIILSILLSGMGYLLRLRRKNISKKKANFHQSLYRNIKGNN